MFRLPLFLLLIIHLVFGPVLASNPTVVTSIRPLQMIANEILGEAGQAELLIDESQNPHHFHFKPSDLRLLSKADLVIWISNEFETGMEKSRKLLSDDSQQLELLKFIPEQLTIGRTHDIDGHIWLSPEMIIIISKVMADKFIQLMPQQAKTIRLNHEQLRSRIENFQITTQELLAHKDILYVLDHPFLNYFERSFKLSHVGTLRELHDHGGKIRQLSQLHEKLKMEPATCLIISRLPPSKQAKDLQQQYNLDLVYVDILNVDRQNQSIVDLLEEVRMKLQSCQARG